MKTENSSGLGLIQNKINQIALRELGEENINTPETLSCVYNDLPFKSFSDSVKTGEPFIYALNQKAYIATQNIELNNVGMVLMFPEIPKPFHIEKYHIEEITSESFMYGSYYIQTEHKVVLYNGDYWNYIGTTDEITAPPSSTSPDWELISPENLRNYF